MAKFLKSQGTYIAIAEVESIKEVFHSGSSQVHVSTKSGACHVMPWGIPAAFIMELLIQGEVIDVQKEFQLYTDDL
jgi:hypothetical protein